MRALPDPSRTTGKGAAIRPPGQGGNDGLGFAGARYNARWHTVAARHVFLLLMLFIQTPATGIAQTLTTYTYTGNPFSVAAC